MEKEHFELVKSRLIQYNLLCYDPNKGYNFFIKDHRNTLLTVMAITAGCETEEECSDFMNVRFYQYVDDWRMKLCKDLGLRYCQRNIDFLTLPRYLTAKEIDEHLRSRVPEYTIEKPNGEKWVEYVIEKECSFDDFLLTLQISPELKELALGPIHCNFYTQFVYYQILKNERDYFYIILGALCDGSNAELAPLLNNIGNGQSATTDEQLLKLAHLSYIDEFYEYMNTSVYNSVCEMIVDFETLPHYSSVEDALEGLAGQLMCYNHLVVNGNTYQITSVEALGDFEEVEDSDILKLIKFDQPEAGQWVVWKNRLCINFASERLGMNGAFLICSMRNIETGEYFDTSSALCAHIFSYLNSSLRETSIDLSFVSSGYCGEFYIRQTERSELPTIYPFLIKNQDRKLAYSVNPDLLAK